MALCGIVGGCSVEWRRDHPLGCPLDEKSWLRDALYFGAARPDGGSVSDAEWEDFERATLLPAFPDGYSVIDASGRWRGNDGDLVRERTRLVVVDHPDDIALDKTVRAVARAYRERFKQEAVLRERSAVCVAFDRG